jgi:hypothetical protein
MWLRWDRRRCGSHSDKLGNLHSTLVIAAHLNDFACCCMCSTMTCIDLRRFNGTWYLHQMPQAINICFLQLRFLRGSPVLRGRCDIKPGQGVNNWCVRRGCRLQRASLHRAVFGSHVYCLLFEMARILDHAAATHRNAMQARQKQGRGSTRPALFCNVIKTPHPLSFLADVTGRLSTGSVKHVFLNDVTMLTWLSQC